MPERKKPSQSKGAPLTWDQIVAKLFLLGLPKETIQGLTLYQSVNILYEVSEDLKTRWRMAGADIKDEPKELTVQDLFALGM